MNRNWGWLLTVALAVFALSRGLPSSAADVGTPAQPGESLAVKSDDAAAREREARAAAPPKCAEGEQLLEQYRELYWPEASGARAPRFRYLIALVPDPEESGHTDYFDAVLEGIEDAAAEGAVDFWRDVAAAGPSVRYVRDHYWLPWSESDKKKRQSRCWEQQPGVILYRPAGAVASNPPLVVLLVGETPTWGVRAQVLEAALQIAGAAPSGNAAAVPSAAQHRRWFRILGPTFSGSAPALRAVLERYVARRVAGGTSAEGALQPPDPEFQAEVRVASGTATGEDVQSTLERGLVAGAPAAAARAALHVSYSSAVPSYGALLHAMLAFLKGAGGESALLTESGTAYGELPAEQGEVLTLRKFPPNLISLRKAYTAVDPDDEQSVTRAPAAGADHAEAQGELSDQTPISHDLALAEVLGELSRGRVRNVGISATDARDVIFIAERVGVQLPDVRLFSIGFDLRYLHPEHAKVLNGLLVAHAAPPPPAPAASMVSQNPMTQRVSAAGQFLLADRPLEPLARISLIGNGSIRQIADDLAEGGRVHAAAVEAPRSYWIAYDLALLILAAAVVLVTGPGLLRLLARRGWCQAFLERTTSLAFLRRRSPLATWFRRLDHAELAADDAAASLALMSLVIAAPLMLTPGLGLKHWLALALAWGVPGCIWLANCICWLPRARAAAPAARGMVVLMLAVACASIGIGWAPAREANVWLLSGGSPLIGGLVGTAMLLAVAWCWRVRLRALDLLRLGAAPDSAFAGVAPPIAQILGHVPGEAPPSPVLVLERRLLQVLRNPWLGAPLLPALVNVGVLASVAAVAFFKPILTFEPGLRHALLVGVGIASILPITTCFAHLLVVAGALQQLLQAIASPGLLAALGRIPRGLSFRLESELVHARRGAGELAVPVQCLGRLAEQQPDLAQSAQQVGAALEDQLRFEAGVVFTPQTQPAALVDELLSVACRLSRGRTQPPAALEEPVEDYRAGLVAIFIARYLQQLRAMVAPIVCGCVLAILMSSLYFVQPRHLVATATFMWVTAIILTVVASYLSLARDAVLSAIGGTVAGSVDLSWGLVARIGAVTVVPLASFVTSQYPEFVFWLTSLFGNVTRFVQ